MIPRLVITAILLGTLLPATAVGQTYENTTHVLVSGGTSTPVGGLSDFWSTGPQGRLTLRFATGSSMSIGLQAGVAGLHTDDGNSELVQYPMRIMAYFPLAPEGSGTPYIAVGAGPTVNMFGCKEKVGPCYLADNKDDTRMYFAYSVMLGYTMRPEAMANTFFDFGIRYDQQVINDKTDYKNLDVEVGIGLAF